MKGLKKFVAAATLLTMLAATTPVVDLEGQTYYEETGGYGYADSSTVPSLTTEIALGTIAVVAIVAIAIRHGHHGHSGHSSHAHQ